MANPNHYKAQAAALDADAAAALAALPEPIAAAVRRVTASSTLAGTLLAMVKTSDPKALERHTGFCDGLVFACWLENKISDADHADLYRYIESLNQQRRTAIEAAAGGAI